MPTQQKKRNHPPKKKATARLGNWLPDDPEAVQAWLDDLHEQMESREEVKLHPVIEEFQELIDRDSIVRMYLTEAIRQVPRTRKHPKNIDHLLALLNEILTRAPEYDDTAMVGVPINAILDWCMVTPAGYAAFRYPGINAMLKKILNAWCEFLSSEASLYVLNDTPTGWKCPAAYRAMSMDDYQHDPDDPFWGFTSWNDFFTRRFKEGRRPIAEPKNDKIIVSACEATPYAIKSHVQREDQFWIKSQPYSLQDMLGGAELTDRFVDGTVYQAFLSAMNYHRWHSPVSGKVVDAYVQEGTYYSEAESAGQDPEGPDDSQGYLAHVATRAIIFIEADDPMIGLLCVIPVGMGDVSSCVLEPRIKKGRRVKKGDELGYFQFGGSTYCLVFRPGAVESFSLQALPQHDNPHPPLVLMGSHLATAP
jgi:phosphatidylserine decarboxylase